MGRYLVELFPVNKSIRCTLVFGQVCCNERPLVSQMKACSIKKFAHPQAFVILLLPEKRCCENPFREFLSIYR